MVSLKMGKHEKQKATLSAGDDKPAIKFLNIGVPVKPLMVLAKGIFSAQLLFINGR
jgi:hypothetical protein